MTSDEYLRQHTIGELTPLSGPIHIEEYDPAWPQQFQRESETIASALRPRALRIEHVGSTAVPDLPAKPIVDIVLEVAASADEPAYTPELEAAGYLLRIREPEWHQHRLFKKHGVNLHVFTAGCPEIARMLAFRDRLRADAADRELYARTKRALAQQEWKHTQYYADAKTAVIQGIMSRSGLDAPAPHAQQ